MKLSKIAVLILTGSVTMAQAAVIDLDGLGYVQYGDAQSYSLPVAEIQTGDSAYSLSSTPGQISDLIVVATGSAGGPVNTNFSGMDNAYSTPTGSSGGNFFSTGTQADANEVSSFSGDQADTWDASLAALMSFLAGDDMVFMFNNNNLNGANEQSLAAWAQVTITDDNNTIIGTYDFTNDNGKYGLVSEGGGGTFLGDVTSYTSTGSGPDGNTNDNTDYVLSGGPLCLDTTSDPLMPIPVVCDGNEDEGPVNHNLGADSVAYAVLFPELNEQLAGLFSGLTPSELNDYTMNIDLRLGCDQSLFGGGEDDEICNGVNHGYGKNINNGYEQVFIATAQPTEEPEPPVEVPEPKSLWILMFIAALFMTTRCRTSE